jgi:hypothetical protein
MVHSPHKYLKDREFPFNIEAEAFEIVERNGRRNHCKYMWHGKEFSM